MRQRPSELVAGNEFGGRIEPLVRAMRPVQWTKNALLLAGVVFARKLLEPGPLMMAVLALISFCALSSAIYVIDDLHDAPFDRLHPTKRDRPIAAGQITTNGAWTLAGALAVFGLAIAAGLGGWFLFT